MEKCLVTTFKKKANNSNLRKYGELRLKAISDGTLTLRPEYGDVVLAVLSGSASYDGQPITTGTPISQTSNNVTITVTNGTVLSIENKYALSSLRTTVMELTDGDSIESLYYSSYKYIQLAGNTSGSISGLDTTKLIQLRLDNTKVEGSIDIFVNSSVIKLIQVSYTNVGGNLSSLVNKDLDIACHFTNSNIQVNLADIKDMSSGNTATNKYQNTYLYGDASSLPASENTIYAQEETKIMQFTWLTQRHNTSGAYIIGNQSNSGTMFINYGTYLDDMLLDQAQCTASSSATKTIIVYGTHTDNSGWETAVATLKSKGYTVTINGETL